MQILNKIISPLVIIGLLFFVIPIPRAQAAGIAIDTVVGLANPDGSNHITIAVGNITNPFIAVFIRLLAATTITAVSCGGVSLVKSASEAGVGVNGQIDLWTAPGIPVNQTVTCTFSGSAPTAASIEMASYSGVAQTSTVDQSGSTADAGLQLSVSKALTPGDANEWMIFGVENSGGSAISSQTNVTMRNGAGTPGCSTQNLCRIGDSNAAIAKSVSNTQTVSSAGTQHWDAVAITIRAVSATTFNPYLFWYF